MKFIADFVKVIKQLGEFVSNFVNFVLLLPVYLLGIGLTSLIAKLFKKQFLDYKIFKKKQSYWSDVKPHKKESYYRQF